MLEFLFLLLEEEFFFSSREEEKLVVLFESIEPVLDDVDAGVGFG